MKIFTFITTRQNYMSGEYDFIVEEWLEALEYAVNFAIDFNQLASNENYEILFDLNKDHVRVTPIKLGFVNIRGRTL